MAPHAVAMCRANRDRLFISFMLASLLLCGAAGHAGESVRVMTFNLWHGGDAGKQPLSQTLEVIRAARADIVGLQETHGYEKDGVRPDHGQRLASMLGWRYYDQGERTGVLSRFPILTNTPSRRGVNIVLSSGRRAFMFNVHFAHAPYQPYQLLGIPYANAPFIKTEQEAIREARAARGRQIEELVAELRVALMSGLPVFLTGDFNEPSHEDWTTRAAAAGKCPLKVEYPSTQAIVAAGMRDTYRAVFPDEVQRPGWTWTPITPPDDPKDRHDRIDFVFIGGAGVRVNSSRIVGEDRRFADIVVQPYPSDHRAVVSEITLP